MKKNISPVFFTLLATAMLLSVVFFKNVQAQEVPIATTPSPDTNIGGPKIDLTPANPAPGESVSAKLITYSIDLNRADITWLLNDRILVGGVGKTEVTFTAGDSGSTQMLKAIIAPQNGAPTSVSTLIRPALLTIAWEAETYTPPLYRGKALQGPEATVKFVALPYLIYENGTVADPRTLIYEWRLNEQPLAKFSGAGKQSLRVKNTKFIKPLNISLTVHSPDNKLFAEAKTTAKVTSVEINLYELHPRYGAWYDKAVGSAFGISGGELNLLAEPFYYSIAHRADEKLSYLWKVGQNGVDAREVLTLRPVGEGGGASRLSLEVTSKEYILQSASRLLSVTFAAGNAAGGANDNVAF